MKPEHAPIRWSYYFDRGNLDREGRYHYRVESGSGIAGRGHAWNANATPGVPYRVEYAASELRCLP